MLIGRRYVDDKAAALEKLLGERVHAVRREEELFRTGLEAHLKTLNHETDRINAIVAKTITLEKYEGDQRFTVAEIGDISDRMRRQHEEYLEAHRALRERVVEDMARRYGATEALSGEAVEAARAAKDEAKAASVFSRIAIVVSLVLSIAGWIVSWILKA